MADRQQATRPGDPEHALGTGGDQDIVKGPRASDDSVFIRVGTAEDPFEADLLAGALEDEEIPVVARAQKDHLLDPLVNPNVPTWAVMVPSEYARRAYSIVERSRAEMRDRAADFELAAREEERLGEEPAR